jgi:hypothetical protein
LIHLDPADKETAKFLAEAHEQYPPGAFQISNEQKKALSQLPETTFSGDTCLKIIPFPAFTSCGLVDYMGRTIEENIEAIRRLTGFPLPVSEKNADNINILGRSFWAAFIRGAYQGAVYYIENLREK